MQAHRPPEACDGIELRDESSSGCSWHLLACVELLLQQQTCPERPYRNLDNQKETTRYHAGPEEVGELDV